MGKSATRRKAANHRLRESHFVNLMPLTLKRTHAATATLHVSLASDAFEPGSRPIRRGRSGDGRLDYMTAVR